HYIPEVYEEKLTQLHYDHCSICLISWVGSIVDGLAKDQRVQLKLDTVDDRDIMRFDAPASAAIQFYFEARGVALVSEVKGTMG
ncbi:hypothetical protein Lal_00041632, partial [Lupinus albus]